MVVESDLTPNIICKNLLVTLEKLPQEHGLSKDDIVLGGIYWLRRPLGDLITVPILANYTAEGLEQGFWGHPCAVVDLQDGSNRDGLSVFVCIVRAPKSIYGSLIHEIDFSHR